MKRTYQPKVGKRLKKHLKKLTKIYSEILKNYF